MKNFRGKRVFRRCGAIALAAFFAPGGLALGRPAVEPLADSAFGSRQANTQAALRDALTTRGSDQAADTPATLLAYYASRNFTPSWTGSAEAESAAAKVLAVLARADEQGLRSADYGGTAARWDVPPAAGAEAAQYELSLTADLLRYASDVCLGAMYPRDVYKDVLLPARRFDVGQALNVALKAHAIDAFLAGLPPPHPQYQGLVEALARYRTIAGSGGWPVVPGKGEVAIEQDDARTRALVQRLALEDPVLAGQPQPMTGDIQEALRRYQERNGMTPDGRAGTATLAELNKPVSLRIGQIVANMERWRWLPHTLEKRYIFVNVPDQSAQYVQDGEVVLTSRVIVGRLTSRTPITRLVVSAVVANPPWNVPDDIAAAQILPHLRNSPNYLASRNMILTNEEGEPVPTDAINWRTMNAKNFPYLVQQNPGPDSAMGVLMMDSPNMFGVYLHDTPGKALFGAAMRQSSNGCIRVQQMMALSSLALTGDVYDGADRLSDAILTKQTQRLELETPLPVYLLYWTAIAGEDGTVGFRPDFYGRDKPLIQALSRPHLAAETPSRLLR